MQRMVGLGQTERVTSFIGNLAAAFPEAADKLNVDEAIDDYADRAGSPPKIIRSDDEVEQLREARQQQKNAAAAAAAMPAVKDGADAARLLSEAAQNGGGVQNLVGGPGL
jgi:Xaa-Pro aminopeptidase